MALEMIVTWAPVSNMKSPVTVLPPWRTSTVKKGMSAHTGGWSPSMTCPSGENDTRSSMLTE